MKFLGIVGSSGSGKTTLIVEVLPHLRRHGLRVSTLKHAHHGFDIDQPGKDSYRHRKAGAEEVMVVSDGRWALLREQQDGDVSLNALARRMTDVDVLLIEGFKTTPIPKIEVYRPSLQMAPLYPQDSGIIALASDEPVEGQLPCLPLNDAAAVAAFIATHVLVSP